MVWNERFRWLYLKVNEILTSLGYEKKEVDQYAWLKWIMGSFDDLDSGLVKHADWDKLYAVITHVMIDIADAYIVCGIEFGLMNFNIL